MITGATIAGINTSTGVEYDTTSNASGDYDLPDVPPGTYRIEIEKTGFKKLIKPDVILHVQDALEIDFELTLGAASDTITVEAGAPPVNTESATVSTVIDHRFVDNLPLNGRSFQTLILLTPGVVLTATAFDDQGQFSVNGQRADANYFTVDGVSANFGVTGYVRTGAKRRRSPYPRSAFRAAPIVLSPWTPCRSFASKPLRSLPSSDAPPADRSRSSHAPERTIFMARCSSISGTTRSTPATGL